VWCSPCNDDNIITNCLLLAVGRSAIRIAHRSARVRVIYIAVTTCRKVRNAPPAKSESSDRSFPVVHTAPVARYEDSFMLYILIIIIIIISFYVCNRLRVCTRYLLWYIYVILLLSAATADIGTLSVTLGTRLNLLPMNLSSAAACQRYYTIIIYNIILLLLCLWSSRNARHAMIAARPRVRPFRFDWRSAGSVRYSST